MTQEQFDQILPLAVAWAEGQECAILRDGEPLSDSQMADAKALGVVHPQKVRLLRVPTIPIPQHPALRSAAIATNLISAETAGLTLRFGILIQESAWSDRKLVCHELVHVHQYERLGGFQGFLAQYLRECVNPPFYPNGPLEREAIDRADALCRQQERRA